jgi:hypothetical protein
MMTGDRELKIGTNLQTVKVTVDGMDLTWSRAEGDKISPEAGAKFMSDFVKALQKFRETDPRTMPELRKEVKARKARWLYIRFAILLCFSVLAAYQCGSEPPGRVTEAPRF